MRTVKFRKLMPVAPKQHCRWLDLLILPLELISVPTLASHAHCALSWLPGGHEALTGSSSLFCPFPNLPLFKERGKLMRGNHWIL